MLPMDHFKKEITSFAKVRLAMMIVILLAPLAIKAQAPPEKQAGAPSVIPLAASAIERLLPDSLAGFKATGPANLVAPDKLSELVGDKCRSLSRIPGSVRCLARVCGNARRHFRNKESVRGFRVVHVQHRRDREQTGCDRSGFRRRAHRWLGHILEGQLFRPSGSASQNVISRRIARPGNAR